MIRANFISPKGAWQAKPADTIVLDFDERHRRRVAMKGTNGLEFLLDLRLDEGPMSEAEAYERLDAWVRERGPVD